MKRYVNNEEVKLVPNTRMDIFLLGMVYRRTFEGTVGWVSLEVTKDEITHLLISADKLRYMCGNDRESTLSALTEKILHET